MATNDQEAPSPFIAVPFEGPDELAREVSATYGEGYLRPGDVPKLSSAAIRSLIRTAYLASQQPNEGRLPRLRLFVPGECSSVQGMIVPLDTELTIRSLSRLAPVLEAPEMCAVVVEQEGVLRIAGIASRARGFTELTFGDPVLGSDVISGDGLHVEVLGPGDLRAGQRYRHRLVSGRVRQEAAYSLEDWFLEWADEATSSFLGREVDQNANRGAILGGVWDHLLWRVAGFRHGGSLVILPDPTHAALPLRRTFRVNPTCNLGDAFALVYLTASNAWQNLTGSDKTLA
jgi:hypothetical protein